MSQEHGLTIRNLPNFTLNNRYIGRQISCKGEPQALDDLEHKVTAGYVQRPTSGDGLQCLIYALEISLKGLHLQDGKRTPTFRQLQEYQKSQAYEDLLTYHSQELGPETVSEMNEGENHLSTMAVLLLALVSDEMEEVYQLGHIDDRKEDEAPPHFVLYPYGDLRQRQPTKTVWVLRETREGTLSHWSGVAPDPTLYKSSDTSDALLHQQEPPSLTTHEQELADLTTREHTSIYKDVFFRAQEVFNAPPNYSNIPYELVQGITAAELIFFFPNHVLHWPPITARVLADGYKVSEIANIIKCRNKHWKDKGEWDEKDMREWNSFCALLRQCIDKSQKKFLKEIDAKSPQQEGLGRKAGVGSLSKEILESESWTEWTPVNTLRPPWTLRKLAQNFNNMGLRPLTKKESVTSRDSFTKIILEEARRISEYPPSEDTVQMLEVPNSSDPPKLPQGWERLAEAQSERQPGGIISRTAIRRRSKAQSIESKEQLGGNKRSRSPSEITSQQTESEAQPKATHERARKKVKRTVDVELTDGGVAQTSSQLGFRLPNTPSRPHDQTLVRPSQQDGDALFQEYLADRERMRRGDEQRQSQRPMVQYHPVQNTFYMPGGLSSMQHHSSNPSVPNPFYRQSELTSMQHGNLNPINQNPFYRQSEHADLQLGNFDPINAQAPFERPFQGGQVPSPLSTATNTNVAPMQEYNIGPLPSIGHLLQQPVGPRVHHPVDSPGQMWQGTIPGEQSFSPLHESWISQPLPSYDLNTIGTNIANHPVLNLQQLQARSWTFPPLPALAHTGVQTAIELESSPKVGTGEPHAIESVAKAASVIELLDEDEESNSVAHGEGKPDDDHEHDVKNPDEEVEHFLGENDNDNDDNDDNDENDGMIYSGN